MTYTLELENKEDFPKIKKFLEQIKGAKIIDNEEVYDNELPDYFYEALDNYAKTVREEDCISEEEFFAKARQKVCELYYGNSRRNLRKCIKFPRFTLD